MSTSATTTSQGFKNKRQSNTFDSRRKRPRRKPNDPSAAPASSPQTPKCAECSTEEQPKYKCPTCRAPYCSIECCRKHKERACVVPQKQQQQQNLVNGDNDRQVDVEKKKSKYLPSDQLTRDPIQNALLHRKKLDDDKNDEDDEYEDLDAGWKITEEMMNEIDKSDWLRQELQDGGLRQLVWEVCSASKRITHSGNKLTHQEELLQAMSAKHPMFKVFLDKLKVLTGILERQCAPGDENVDLKDWLEQEGHDLGTLTLKPLRRHRDASALPQLPTNEDSSLGGSSSSASDESDEDSVDTSSGSDNSSASDV